MSSTGGGGDKGKSRFCTKQARIPAMMSRLWRPGSTSSTPATQGAPLPSTPPAYTPDIALPTAQDVAAPAIAAEEDPASVSPTLPNLDESGDIGAQSDDDDHGEDDDVVPPDHQLGRKQIVFKRDGKSINKDCPKTLRSIFRDRLHPTATSWTQVTNDYKEYYWEEFKKKYVWNEDENDRVFQAFWKISVKRYKDLNYRARTTDTCPAYIDEPIWQGFRAQFEEPDRAERSQTSQINRRKGRAVSEPAMPTHFGGSRTQLETQDVFSRERGREVSDYDVYLHYKTKNHDGVTWTDDHAKEVNDRYLASLATATESGEEVNSNALNALLIDAVGGFDSHGNIFGLGSLANKYDRPTRQRGSSSSSHTATEVSQLREQLSHMTEELVNEREQRLNIERQVAETNKRVAEQFEEQARKIAEFEEQSRRMAEFEEQSRRMAELEQFMAQFRSDPRMGGGSSSGTGDDQHRP